MENNSKYPGGLIYGNRFKKKPSYQHEEGIFYIDNIGKWIVRIKKSPGIFTTIAAYPTEREAEAAYQMNRS